ncbi:MAG: DUF3047 domain-containing protein [Gammaproteobacteria bacterium]|nr:DUF3047 domain-containing protein [Gammaproteobacteria bacterium]
MAPPGVQAKPGALRQLAIVGTLARRSLGRRLRGQLGRPRSFDQFRADLQLRLATLPSGALAAHAFHFLPATCPPWFDTGVDVAAGDRVTLVKEGRVYLSRLLDIWVPASFQVWCRIGEQGPIFRGTRDSHTFTAGSAGRLWLANYFPGEWADRSGKLATSAAEYAKVSGGTSVLLVKWARGAHAETLVGPSGAEVQPPETWDYLWFLGPAEIYRPSLTPDGRPAIDCHTHGDVGILQRDARWPLVPGTKLRWSWRVEQLPTDLDEDTLPSHDYLSIAVEFDDGQDLTYYWSASLPVGKVYRCPLPNWTHKETHVVVRSGPKGLGEWLAEERDLHRDYARYIGGPAREIVKVWLIANSLTTRGHGRCEYAGIELSSAEEKIEVL